MEKLFTFILIGIILVCIIFHEKIFKFFKFNDVNGNSKKENVPSLRKIIKLHWPKLLIFFTPVFIIAYFEYKYSILSFKKFGFSNESVNFILRILGAYGIIQILAQDTGLKTGVIQKQIVQTKLVQFLLFLGIAYSVTDQRNTSLIAVIIYFILKYAISNGKTTKVCFDEV